MSNFDLYQFVTDQVVSALETGLSGRYKCPWEKEKEKYKCPWDNMSQVATHAVTGRRLTGISQLLCQFSMVEHGFKVSRWLTFAAAKKLGGKVISGSKSTRLCWLRPFVRVVSDGKEKIISPSGDDLVQAMNEGDVFWAYRSTLYFNVEQVSGLKEHFYPPTCPLRNEFNVIDEAESYLKNLVQSCGLVLKHEGTKAYYSPYHDIVVLPEKSLFYKAKGYYGTAFHEVGHWSGAKSRLSRPGIVGNSRFGSDKYAFEELIAELIAVFKSAELGVERSIDDNHVQYISHWLNILKGDKTAIFKASQEAMKAVNYLNDLVDVKDQTLVLQEESA